MAETRMSSDVVGKLFQAMRSTVHSYGTGAIEVTKEIDGTAFFPGGSGLWRGYRKIDVAAQGALIQRAWAKCPA